MTRLSFQSITDVIFIEDVPTNSTVIGTVGNSEHSPAAWSLNTLVFCVRLPDKFEADTVCLIFPSRPLYMRTRKQNEPQAGGRPCLENFHMPPD